MKVEKDTGWVEAHYEVVTYITHNLDNNEYLTTLYERGGRGAMWVLSEDLTDKFIEKYKDYYWDGEFFDKIDEFLEAELNK